MILDMEGILMGGGRADKGINKNQKNIDLETHIVTYNITGAKYSMNLFVLTPSLNYSVSQGEGKQEQQSLFPSYIELVNSSTS